MEGLCVALEDPVIAWGMERIVFKEPFGNNSGILRQHLFGALWGEYVKTSTFIWISFASILTRCPLGWCVPCRCSITSLTQPIHSYLALSPVGSVATHCIPLPAGAVLVGHCGTFVVTLSL